MWRDGDRGAVRLEVACPGGGPVRRQGRQGPAGQEGQRARKGEVVPARREDQVRRAERGGGFEGDEGGDGPGGQAEEGGRRRRRVLAVGDGRAAGALRHRRLRG